MLAKNVIKIGLWVRYLVLDQNMNAMPSISLFFRHMSLNMFLILLVLMKILPIACFAPTEIPV